MINQVLTDLEKLLGINHGICGTEKLTTEARLILIIQEQQVRIDQLGERCEKLESRIGED